MASEQATAVFNAMSHGDSDYQLWTNGYVYKIYKRTEASPQTWVPVNSTNGYVLSFKPAEIKEALHNLLTMRQREAVAKAKWEPISEKDLEQLAIEVGVGSM